MTRGKLDLTSVAAMIQPIRTRSLICLPNTWTLLVSPNNLVIPGNDEGEVGFDQRDGYDTANKKTVRSLSVSFFIEKEPHKQLRMKRKRRGER